MLNLTDTNYPFYSYVPSRFHGIVFSLIVLISLLSWFIQSFHVKCHPLRLSIFVFISHLITFIELVLRAILDINILNTKTLYRVTAPMLTISPRFLLIANYHCLVELRGKKARGILDRIIDIVVPLGAVTADILLGIANEFSFKSNYIHISFHLRQASAGLILGLAALFYIVWYLGVAYSRHFHILLLLGMSSICVLIQAIYIQAISIPSAFFMLNQNELWFYTGHLIPIVLALLTWSIFHPSQLLSSTKPAIHHSETFKELLPLSSRF